jgi:hypothetical protein
MTKKEILERAARDVALVKIGYQTYIVRAANLGPLASILGSATSVDLHYLPKSYESVYVLGEKQKIELSIGSIPVMTKEQYIELEVAWVAEQAAAEAAKAAEAKAAEAEAKAAETEQPQPEPSSGIASSGWKPAWEPPPDDGSTPEHPRADGSYGVPGGVPEGEAERKLPSEDEEIPL